jgi:hypothetical protein
LSLDPAVVGNLDSLIAIRDTAVHLYATESLSYFVYTLGAAALQNYQRFVHSNFGRSLLEYNFYILPLSFAYNFRTLSTLDCDQEPETVAAILRSVTEAQQVIESKDFHLVCEISMELRSAKKFTTDPADISVVVAPIGKDKIVYRTQPLTDRYPLSYYEVIAKIKAALPGSKQHEIDGAIKSLKIKGNPAYSAYNFRTKLQEERARTMNFVPKGMTPIYNENAVRILIETLKK